MPERVRFREGAVEVPDFTIRTCDKFRERKYCCKRGGYLDAWMRTRSRIEGHEAHFLIGQGTLVGFIDVEATSAIIEIGVWITSSMREGGRI
jgi:hypothetical protein